MKRAVIALVGASCTSCSIGIKKMAQHIHGVEYVEVDRAANEVILHYDGNAATIEKIIGFIAAIGYQANLISEETLQTKH